MKIEKLVVGMSEANTYILYDENTLEAMIIDPGGICLKLKDAN